MVTKKIDCLISKESIDAFHTFPQKTIFNKPVIEKPDVFSTRMDIAYNKNNYHISSKTDLSHEETTNLLDEIYTKLYSSYAPVGVSGTQKLFTDFIGDWLLKYTDKESKILEIGCHDGYLLNKFEENGHSVLGIEPSPMASIAKEKYKLDVIQDFFTRESCEDEDFNFIIMRHVLEHVPDPYEFLLDSFSKLKVGGKMYVEVPNSLWSLENSFFPEFHIDHISYFTIGSLQKIISMLPNSKIEHIEQFQGYIRFPFLGALITKTADNKFEEKMNFSPLLEFSIDNAINRFQDNYNNYLKNLKEIDVSQGLVVWGTGSIGTQYAVDASWSDSDVSYVDINESAHGLVLSSSGHEVLDPKVIKKIRPKNILIASAWENDVKKQLEPFCIGGEKILTFSDLLN